MSLFVAIGCWKRSIWCSAKTTRCCFLLLHQEKNMPSSWRCHAWKLWTWELWDPAVITRGRHHRQWSCNDQLYGYIYIYIGRLLCTPGSTYSLPSYRWLPLRFVPDNGLAVKGTCGIYPLVDRGWHFVLKIELIDCSCITNPWRIGLYAGSGRWGMVFKSSNHILLHLFRAAGTWFGPP